MDDGRLDAAGETQPITRRAALGRCAAAAAFAGLGGASGAGAADDGALDEALECLHAREPASVQGLSTHAPMVAEALAALGRGDRAVAWVRAYDGPERALPVAALPIDLTDWRAALGPRADAPSWEASLHRYGDWQRFFAEALAEASWQSVLDTWVGRLAPGLAGAATHGIIRSAHAARALGRKETPVRLAELSRGLAYWAASYQEVPGRAAGAGSTEPAERSATYEAALAQVPLYTELHGRSPGGNIVAGLRAAAELEGFAPVRDGAPAWADSDLHAGLSALTATFARVYLRHGTRHHAIAFIHAVTGPAALRKLAPYLRPATAAAALPFAWQAAAAIFAVYARRDDPPRVHEAGLGRAELVERALHNGDEHAIKFTEVLLAEDSLRPDPAYRAAAEDVIQRL